MGYMYLFAFLVFPYLALTYLLLGTATVTSRTSITGMQNPVSFWTRVA